MKRARLVWIALAAGLAASCIRHVDLVPADAAIDAPIHPDAAIDAPQLDSASVAPDAMPDSAIDAQ